ncbi:hypothetical protein, partial [uncultured Rummeliibacillus sp.]|uniref:hypothetical protein n=1 Tax=uncultured Rummeliibacillus sp. TaxID=762292 RepID=UPI002624C009
MSGTWIQFLVAWIDCCVAWIKLRCAWIDGPFAWIGFYFEWIEAVFLIDGLHLIAQGLWARIGYLFRYDCLPRI